MSTVDLAPRFSKIHAQSLAHRLYGLTALADELPSERDQNFLLTSTDNKRFVLKIANPAEDRAVLELQNRAMIHLGRIEGRSLCPLVFPDREGRQIVETAGPDGREYAVRLVSYIDGVPLAGAHPQTPDLLFDLGRFTARLVNGLKSFEHPSERRDFHWDVLMGARTVKAFKDFISSPERRALVERGLADFESQAGPQLSRLDISFVHNDGNDHNIIVSCPDTQLESFGLRSVAGIIDFGDLVRSYTLAELAVVCAYVMFGKPDPLAAAGQVISGYHTALPLTALELELLYHLIRLRLLMSVTICAHQTQLRPDNTYLTISNRQAWALLELLQQVHPRFARSVFRAACGLPPCPEESAVVEWLEAHRAEFASVTGFSLEDSGITVFDLSVGSPLIDNPEIVENTASFSELLFGEMRKAGSAVGIGRYGEARLIRRPENLRPGGRLPAEGRTVHLGMDLYLKPGAPVFAPLDGVVHSMRNNAARNDYGPTVILEHRAETGGGPLSFYTLYGHLTGNSLETLEPGRRIGRGERIGFIGSYPENGDWPPHLHFQVILDMLGEEGHYPGLARFNERAVWLSLCPDPNLILGIREAKARSMRLEPGEIIELRKAHIARVFSISYMKPLKIVRGFRQHLYDYTGRVYLDAVNNVPHVGHSHPRVVEAVRRQLAVLNTNTRYLHDNLVLYAQRLTALLPEPLRVCFIVNSGSEANDLALRLARSFTGRKDMVVLEGAYHGHLDSLIEISPYKFDGPGGRGKPASTHVVPMPDLYQGPYRSDDPEAGAKYAGRVRDVISRARAQGREIAGFICESLLSCAGQIVLPEGFLKEAYVHVRESGAVCIADEVQVGFGRVGTHFWGFETQQVVPDIVTMGKPMGNGFPLAAVVTTPEIAEAFATGMEYFNTYGGNPVSCAAGLAVLDVISEEGLQANALAVGARLKSGLEALKERYPLIGDVRGLGLFLGVELVLNRATRARATPQASYVAERMREEGILLSTDGPFRNVLKIKPPLVFSAEDADDLVSTLERILTEDPLRVL